MASPKPRRHGGWLLPLATLAGAALSLSVLIKSTWPGELAASWQPHIAALTLVMAVASLFMGQRFLAVLLAATAVVLVGGVIVSGLGSAQMLARNTAAGTGLRVGWANVYQGNEDLQPLLEWIADSRPDVVVLGEVPPRHVAVLDVALADYPHRILEPRRHAFGMVLYSRLPLLTRRVVPLDADASVESGPVALMATVALADRVVRVIGLHPFSPLSPALMDGRDRQFASMAQLIAGLDGPTVVIGDLNATPWSPALQGFVADARLGGVNFAATWPAMLGFAGIPIDHALVTDDLDLVSLVTGPSIGSDHLPRVVEGVPPGSPGTP